MKNDAVFPAAMCCPTTRKCTVSRHRDRVVEHRHQQPRDDRRYEQRDFLPAEPRERQHRGQRFISENVIDHDLQRPRREQARQCGEDREHDGKGSQPPVRAEVGKDAWKELQMR